MQTKINDLEEAIRGTEILFLAGEYANCLDQLIRSFRLVNTCMFECYSTPPCRDKEEYQNGLTIQQFQDWEYIYELEGRIIELKLGIKYHIDHSTQQQVSDFLPEGTQDPYIWPHYKK